MYSKRRLGGSVLECRRYRIGCLLGALLLVLPHLALAQEAQLSGFVRSPSGSPLSDVAVTLVNGVTAARRETRTNHNGMYLIVSIPPGPYRISAAASGYSSVSQDIRVEVEQNARLDLLLPMSGVVEKVEVNAQVSFLGTNDGSVGTVIDRTFVQNMPLSGRTFHSLLELAPGVVQATNGGFAVSGQRTDSNYMMIDGVSANVSAAGANGMINAASGQTPATTVNGGFNGLVSAEALEEVRVQTSSFAPEFGRTPGAQIGVVTRSGTNNSSGSVFERYRSDALAANDWFANRNGLAKAKLSQHDFGGVLGGPIVKSHLFYFGSYEALRLTQPRTLVTSVPSAAARAAATGLAKELVNLYPTTTGVDSSGLLSPYATNLSDRTELDAISLRVDWNLSSRVRIFGRTATAPSSVGLGAALNGNENSGRLTTVTSGATYVLNDSMVADVRGNYSRNTVGSEFMPNVGAHLFPDGFDYTRALVDYAINGTGIDLPQGADPENRQHQMNVTGSLSVVRDKHQIKVGFDFRRLAPEVHLREFDIGVTFLTLDDLVNNRAGRVTVNRRLPVSSTFMNYSAFAQDTWQPTARVSITAGLRWDVNPAPSFPANEGPVRPVNLDNLATMSLSTNRNEPLWGTRYGDVAPRVATAIALDGNNRRTLTLAVGRFADTGSQAASALFDTSVFPNTTRLTLQNVAMPLLAASLMPAPPSIEPPYAGTVEIVDPDLRTPVTTQWNVKLEQKVGTSGLLSTAYVGARGAQLLSTSLYPTPNASFPGVVKVLDSEGKSRYHGLQVNYRHRLRRTLDLTASYTLSKSTDNVSDALLSRAPDSRQLGDDMGPSDFDVRHVFAGALSWDAGSGRWHGIREALLSNWGVDLLWRARTALPISVLTGRDAINSGSTRIERPDAVSGVPVFLDDPTAPGGKRLNRDAFATPTAGVQGNFERNSLRSFGAWQTDLALRRDIRIYGKAVAQLRFEVFNLFNHANFGLIDPVMTSSTFGVATRSLNTRSTAGGALNTLYQWGGARSAEAVFKVSF